MQYASMATGAPLAVALSAQAGVDDTRVGRLDGKARHHRSGASPQVQRHPVDEVAMNVSASHASSMAAAHARPRPAPPTGPAATDPAPAPVVPTEPPAEKAHGPGRDAAQLHRSEVATLRQWINHPERRTDLELPDLAAAHKGNGFQKAVAAYQAAVGVTPPATDPAPVVDPPVIDPPLIDPPLSDPTPEPAEVPEA
jgi:hypothetical protein